MDRRELLDRAAHSPEERLLLSRVWDKCEHCRTRNIPTATGFLSPAEQAAAQGFLVLLGARESGIFWGGYDGAERAVLLFLPDWMDPSDAGTYSPIRCLRAAFREGENLTHRDFLGSLMALGLTREKIGDILVEKGGCQVLLDPSMTDFLLQNWDSAGREKLTVTPLPLSALAVPHAAVKELRDTVSSLRLDNVLAAGFSLSRGRAAEAVEKGSVQVNYVTCVKPDKPVSAGDTITCRGLGKCVLDSVGAPTKNKGETAMDEKKIARINELARKAKAEGLTDAEIEERAALRQEYLNAVMANARSVLENTYIVDEKGNKRKLRGKGEGEA